MSDMIVWRNKTYVKGTGGVAVWYYADAAKTLSTAIYDLNGAQLASASVSVQAGANDISFQINDWLTANDILFDEGIYVLRVGSYTTPITVSTGAATIDVVDGMYPTSVRIIDLDTGISVYHHPREYNVPINISRLKWLTLQYYYDPQRGMGRLKTPSADTFVQIDTGWARLAGVRTTLKFSTQTDLLNFLGRMVMTDSLDTLKTIGSLVNTNPAQALALLKPFGFVPLLGGLVMSVEVDTVNNVLSIDELVPLGFYDIDTSALKKVAAALGGVGLVVAGAVVGGPVGAVIAVAGLAAVVISVLWPTGERSPSIDEINSRINRGIQQVENTTKDALTTLDTLYSQGQVTDVAYNELKTKINEIRAVAVAALKDVRSIITDYYQEGYEKGYSDARVKWGLAGAFAGFIMHGVLARRGIV